MPRKVIRVANFRRAGLCEECKNFNTVKCPITYTPDIVTVLDLKKVEGTIVGKIVVEFCPYHA